MPPLATQLIIFNGHLDHEVDADTILSAATEAGFKAVETQLVDPPRLRDKLALYNLRHAAIHIISAQLNEPQRWIDYLGITGGRDVCTSGFFNWNARTVEDHRAQADLLNRTGSIFRAAGIFLHYHNHDFELTEHPTPGRTSLEYLVSLLDPAAVDLCTDVAWFHRARVSFIDFVTHHADQIGYLHLKDWDGENWVPLGQGQVDLMSVLQTLPKLTSLRWLTCEQDTTKEDPRECLRVSRAWCDQSIPSFQ